MATNVGLIAEQYGPLLLQLVSSLAKALADSRAAAAALGFTEAEIHTATLVYLEPLVDRYKPFPVPPTPEPVPVPTPPAPVPPVAPYGVWTLTTGAYPTDDELKAKGYKVGDVKWTSSGPSLYWLVAPAGALVGAPPDGFSAVYGTIA